MASTINAKNTSTGVVITPDSSGQLELQTADTTRMTIDVNGNVGVGTTSPTNFGSNFKMLAVQGSDFGVVQAISANGATTLEMMGANGTGFVGTRTNHPLVLRTNDTERMRIDSSGNLLVGTTTAGGRLTVNAVSQNGIELKTSTSSDGFYGLYNNSGSSGTAVYVMPCRFGSTNTFGGGINWTGSVMQYTGTSDARLKENIVDSDSGLKKLENIKIRSFDWKESGKHVDFGVIAQELEEIAPESVAKGKDNEDGTINTPYAVDTSVLVPAMIKAIQELKAIVDTQAERIAVLENKQ